MIGVLSSRQPWLHFRITWETETNKPDAWVTPRTVASESLEVRLRHQYFLSLPRWFQCALKSETRWPMSIMVIPFLSLGIDLHRHVTQFCLMCIDCSSSQRDVSHSSLLLKNKFSTQVNRSKSLLVGPSLPALHQLSEEQWQPNYHHERRW